MGAYLNKVLHLLSIIMVLGGVFYGLVVLGATARDEGTDANAPYRPLWRRWGITLGAAWVVALITGFINMAVVGPAVNNTYSMYLGIKMGLALVMFVVTLLIAHPVPSLRLLQGRRAQGLAALAALGIVVVGLSAQLNMSRISGAGLKPQPAAPAAATPTVPTP